MQDIWSRVDSYFGDLLTPPDEVLTGSPRGEQESRPSAN
jgi:hypothetical protein